MLPPQTQRVINIIDTANTSPIPLALPVSPIQAILRSCALPRRPPPTDFLLLLALKERFRPPATVFRPLPSCPPLPEPFRGQVAKFRGNSMAAVETVACPCILEYRFDIIDILCDVIRYDSTRYKTMQQHIPMRATMLFPSSHMLISADISSPRIIPCRRTDDLPSGRMSSSSRSSMRLSLRPLPASSAASAACAPE